MEIWEIVLIVLGIILFFGLAILAARRARPEARGKRGEDRVSFILNKYIGTKGGYLINDVLLPYGNRTSQIDHILFTKYGIFVIETKNWSGWIYGSQDNQYWTQVIGIKNIQHNKMYSPIKQNEVHCKVVRVHLKIKDPKIYSLVVFTQGNIENIKATEVCDLHSLLERINYFNKPIYSDSQLKDLYNKINHYKLNPPASIEKHVMEIKADHASAI